MATYKYFFTDVMTGNYLGTLPLVNVAATVALSATGSFSADLNLADERFRAAANLSSLIIPGRTAYWVDRNGYIVSGGIVWDDNYDSSTRTYQLTGSTWDSYADHVVIDQALKYTSVDLCSIAIDLWNHAQGGVDGSNVGVVIPATGSVLSGTLDTESYDPSTMTKYGSAIQQLSKLSPGFDYYISTQYASGMVPQAKLVLGGPYVGAPTSTSGLVFRKPGNVQNYKWPRFGSQSPNRVYGVGGGIGQGALQSQYTNQSMVNAGYPITSDVIQYKDIFDQPTLDSVVAAYGLAVSNGVVTPTIQLNPDDPSVPAGSFNVGDACRVVIEPDEYFANGIDTYMRVSSITINPSQAGQEENIVLTLSQAVT